MNTGSKSALSSNSGNIKGLPPKTRPLMIFFISKLIFIPRLYHQIKLGILRKSNMQNKATIFHIFRLFEIYVGVSLWCCSIANAHRILLITFLNILFNVQFLLPYYNYLWSWCRVQDVSLSCLLKWKLPLSKTRQMHLLGTYWKNCKRIYNLSYLHERPRRSKSTS